MSAIIARALSGPGRLDASSGTGTEAACQHLDRSELTRSRSNHELEHVAAFAAAEAWNTALLPDVEEGVFSDGRHRPFQDVPRRLSATCSEMTRTSPPRGALLDEAVRKAMP